MNPNSHDPMAGEQAEATLRLIAKLPAPAGIEERVHASLRAAPRDGRVLAWPARFRAKTALESNWMRAVAAAAIVFVVVGGGWGVYMRVQPGPSGKVIVMPARVPGSGGIQGAGAVRVPTTLPGPKVRAQETKGPRDQETPTAKKAGAPKNVVGTQPPAQVAPKPTVSQ